MWYTVFGDTNVSLLIYLIWQVDTTQVNVSLLIHSVWQNDTSVSLRITFCDITSHSLLANNQTVPGLTHTRRRGTWISSITISDHNIIILCYIFPSNQFINSGTYSFQTATWQNHCNALKGLYNYTYDICRGEVARLDQWFLVRSRRGPEDI